MHKKPLSGFAVIEFEGIGPCPLASMMFADMCALWQAQSSGKGQVIDVAMTDGSVYASSLLWMIHNSSHSADKVGTSWTDGAAPWNDSYVCSDGHYINICALDPKFYRLLLERLGLTQKGCFEHQWEEQSWPEARVALSQKFASQTRHYWCGQLEGSDVCFAPVLNFTETHNTHIIEPVKILLSSMASRGPHRHPRWIITKGYLILCPRLAKTQPMYWPALGILLKRITQLRHIKVV